MNPAKLDAIVRDLSKKKHVRGAVFQFETNQQRNTFATGNLREDSRFYIASINKLVTAALILRLVRDGKLHFEDRISRLLPEKHWKSIHVYKGHDYSDKLTVKHLLSHTSGLPCYIEDKMPDGSRAMDLFLQGKDHCWPMEKVVAAAKAIGSTFPPGAEGKAHYGEVNFRMLDEILLEKTGKEIDQLGKVLFQELGMEQTAFMHQLAPDEYVPIFGKKGILKIDQYAASTKHEILSTVGDLMLLIKAYFEGAFYPKERLESLQDWKKIFFPFKYGVGIQQFYVPWFFSPFKKIPPLIGHCGSVGSVAFNIPEKKTYLTGTVNLAGNPQIAFQALIKMLNNLS
ncbi:serine hydrolase domain-containing protein [Pleomorphovibrio marinus]|uniref:serine hydrolase domain-containing protein n=1 Tax=Pleomorphovibrio marinus TaxID=2164132 RepID=UPI000E0B79D9|nr:serine hydrolase domain-containing protein [Pleomorphovibrio marinus]